jgi:FAD:protein FMN transferase
MPTPTNKTPPARDKKIVRLAGDTMGTRYQVALVVGAGMQTEATDDIARQVQGAVDMVDAQMSNWKATSALSRFNDAAPGDWIPVPRELVQVVETGQKLARQTRGAFDMTLGRAVAQWGFGPHAQDNPGARDTAPARGLWQALSVQTAPPALRKDRPLWLDLSGIAKGYGVDCIAAVLETHSIANYFIVIDGEIRLKGRKPGLDGAWAVALEAPIRDVREAYDILNPQRACALATSGDYRHYRRHDGVIHSHSIDGRSGRPVANDIGSVTVALGSCMMADAWATALLVLGPRDGVAMAQANNIAARFLIRTDTGIRDVMTGDFAAVIG